ncbi:hypothetical protein RFI_23472, partial [Reticulomyxa filosa]
MSLQPNQDSGNVELGAFDRKPSLKSGYSEVNIHDTTDVIPTMERQRSDERRLSRQASTEFLRQMGRRSSVTNIAHFVPSPIANAVPFLNRSEPGAMVQETYFCHICFTNNAKKEGFQLSNCNHMFCTECIKGYWSSRIENGNVHLKNEYCAKEVNELDIVQVVSEDIKNKYFRFKQNLENPNARQCPTCEHTQNGDPHNPIMTCQKCDTKYCLYHSVAHPIDERCEAYESRTLKEDKLNQEVTKDAKSCPRCKYLIEKSGGCNHMK